LLQLILPSFVVIDRHLEFGAKVNFQPNSQNCQNAVSLVSVTGKIWSGESQESILDTEDIAKDSHQESGSQDTQRPKENVMGTP
jgi:hypothetical protein